MDFAIKFVVALILNFLNAAWVMVILGWANEYDSRIPAFGYWATLFLVWAIQSATTDYSKTVESK